MYLPKNYLFEFKLQCTDIKYRVDEKNKRVTAIAEFKLPLDFRGDGNYYFDTVGISHVNPNSKDVFNEKIGKKIARAKAEREAFLRFREMVKRFKLRLALYIDTADTTIKKMNVYINRQDKYIQNF